MAYAIPQVGTEVEVCMKNPLPISARYSGMPDYWWYRGHILKNQKWMGPDMFCLSTDNKESPVRILDQDRILDLRLVDGGEVEHVELKEKPKFQMWQVDGSKDNVYNVTLDNGKWSCDCPASSFRRGSLCKHIKEIQAKV